MFGGDLTRKIRQMSEYLDDNAIAAALRIPLETVREIIQDHVNIVETDAGKETILQITTNPVYRQRVISVWRGRGGAGCSSIAIHLAYLLEQMMSVLLVDLSASNTGSDLGYYLRLPEYPNLEALSLSGQLSSAVIQAESNLWVLLPPTSGIIDSASVAQLATEARKDFDAVIFDLPNTDDEFVLKAVAYSNALVMVTNGLFREMNRSLARKNCSQKEAVLVANGYACDRNTRKDYAKVVEIPEDNYLQARMERGVFHKKGSPLTTGAEKIRDMLFEMRPPGEGCLGKIKQYLLAGVVGH
jgi:MinD-like ATPase involved in chromosome partitioning or flagellar assembly